MIVIIMVLRLHGSMVTCYYALLKVVKYTVVFSLTTERKLVLFVKLDRISMEYKLSVQYSVARIHIAQCILSTGML